MSLIIGTGAGGGTLAARLAPSGLRILLLERGDFLPREKENWDARAVFVYEDLAPYYTRAKRMYHVHGERDTDPSEPPADEPYPYPAVSHEPRQAGPRVRADRHRRIRRESLLRRLRRIRQGRTGRRQPPGGRHEGGRALSPAASARNSADSALSNR